MSLPQVLHVLMSMLYGVALSIVMIGLVGLARLENDSIPLFAFIAGIIYALAGLSLIGAFV